MILVIFETFIWIVKKMAGLVVVRDAIHIHRAMKNYCDWLHTCCLLS